MSDIFISYSSSDRPRAKALADALSGQGFSVGWDRKIPAGEAFDEELEQQLDTARAIVVLWTPQSVKSKWVRDETSEGLARKNLFPVMMDPVKPPFGYRRIQTVDFTAWQAGTPHLGFDQLVASLKRKFAGGQGPLELEGDHPGPAAVPANWWLNRWRRSVVFRLGMLAMPALLLGGAALVLAVARPAVRIQLETVVERIRFTSAAAASAPALELPPFVALTIERFRAVKLWPGEARAIAAEQLESDAPVWRVLPSPTAEWNFVSTDAAAASSLRLESADGSKLTAGTLDTLRLPAASDVTLARHGASLLIKLDGKAFAPAAVSHARLRIDAQHTAPALGLAPSQVYEVQPRPSSPEIRIESEPSGLTLRLQLAEGEARPLISAGGTAISDVQLIHLAAGDGWAATLLQEGKLSFPDHPGLPPVQLAQSDLIGLQGLSRFAITELRWLSPGVGLQLKLDGRATQVQAKSGDFVPDLRPSLLARFRANANLAFLLSWAMTVLSATGALFGWVKELRGQSVQGG